MCGPEPTREPAPPPYEVYTSLLSHELRTPVTSILGFLDLLAEEGLMEDPQLLREYLGIVRGRAADLARVVSELTQFADLAAGRTPRVGDDGEGQTLAAVVHDLAGHSQHPVQLEADERAAAAPVDTDRLRVALLPLLDNAFKFGRPSAEVRVRATLEGDPERLVLRVINEGEPIPDALRARIFAPFSQGEEPARRRHGGLGLGLTVASRAAERAGGSLTLEPGEPTTFRLTLPLRDDPLAREAQALRKAAEQADAQTLQVIRDLRTLRKETARERAARELAEAQQLRLVADFRAEHQRATALTRRLDEAYLETITALARAVEARDQYTGGHVERVRAHSVRIGREMRLERDALRQLEFGAVLHDVGKIGVPDAVLSKPGPLDPDEWTLMRRHPEIGRLVLEGIAFLTPALPAVACHHERWDGRGYPHGLSGPDIPLLGRIVAVADTFDAMTTDRPYRAGLPAEVARAEIERGRGSQFDPDVAATFLATLQEAAAAAEAAGAAASGSA